MIKKLEPGKKGQITSNEMQLLNYLRSLDQKRADEVQEFLARNLQRMYKVKNPGPLTKDQRSEVNKFFYYVRGTLENGE